MSRLLPLLAALLTAAALVPAQPVRAQTFPDYTSTTVNDFADLLPAEDERALVDRLTRLERETGVELTVVTLATQSVFAPDLTLEDFATGLFDHWGVGKAGTNDGVMILVLRDDRAMRIELGAAYGRGWDSVARDIVDRNFLTAFEVGDYPRGIVNGTGATIDRIVLPFRGGEAAPNVRRPGGLPDWLIAAGIFGAALLLMARNRIGDLFARLRSCPQCGRRGLRQTRTTLTAASRSVGGLGERLRTCPHCGYEDRTTFQIPKVRSSSGGGSFGGGRSGGGGASGRW